MSARPKIEHDDEEPMATVVELSTPNTRIVVEPEVAKAYQEYLKDWRWRMRTFREIESQQLGHHSRAFPGESLV